MTETCNQNCDSCQVSSCSDRKKVLEEMVAAPGGDSKVKHVIGVVSGKGGVGKSSITALVAAAVNKRGYKTAILDADITGPSIPRAFGITAKAKIDENGIIPELTRDGIKVMSINLLLENTTDAVIWRGPMIAGTVRQFWTDVNWGDIDYMFVDMPPGTGDVPLTVYQSLPLEGIILVTSPQQLVSMIVEKAANMAQTMFIPILGIVENMSYVECPDCGKKIEVFGPSHLAETAEIYDIQHISRLPLNAEIAQACDNGTVEDLEGNWLEEIIQSLLLSDA